MVSQNLIVSLTYNNLLNKDSSHKERQPGKKGSQLLGILIFINIFNSTQEIIMIFKAETGIKKAFINSAKY